MLSDISTWILSIAGVICLSVIIELILPDGQMNRYVKGIFSFIVILIIIAPIPKLLNQKFSFSEIFDYNSSIEIDNDYLYQINLDKLSTTKKEIEDKILSHGYENVSVYLNCDIKDKNMIFKSVTVDLTDLVITSNAEHKNIAKIREDITKIIMSFIDIEEEGVLYDI